MTGTIREIAERAGVSRGTVDRAVNQRGRINRDVEERILQIADEIGYVPRRKKDEKKKKIKIGVITQLSEAPFMIRIRRGILDAVKETSAKRMELLLRECGDVSEDSQLAALVEMESAGVAGIAIMPVEGNRIRLKLNELSEKGVKIVTFNTDIVGTGRNCFVGMDNLKSGRTAAGLMAVMTGKKGQILAITGHFGNNVSNMRVEGFTHELKRSYQNLSLVGVQSSFDESDEVERIVYDSLTAFPDLKGIVVFSAGQEGIGRAFDRLGLTERPFVVVYDLTPQNIEGLNEDRFDFILDQNGYMQGYKAVALLAELLLEGVGEAASEFYDTDIVIKTKYNL